jgi:hypothetical protein
MTGPPWVLRLAVWSAWALCPLYLVYAAAIAVSGAAIGRGSDPWLAIAEFATIVGAIMQVTLFAAVHECAPNRARTYTISAFGFMLVMAALTVTVHFIELTITRRIDPAAAPAFVFGVFGQPSLLQGVELLAWHLFFGLALLFGTAAFRGHGIEAAARAGLAAGGALCVLGLLGPALANPSLRLIGVFGYGVVFPITCVLIGFVFTDAGRASVLPLSVSEMEDQAHGPATVKRESPRTADADRLSAFAGTATASGPTE